MKINYLVFDVIKILQCDSFSTAALQSFQPKEDFIL